MTVHTSRAAIEAATMQNHVLEQAAQAFADSAARPPFLYELGAEVTASPLRASLEAAIFHAVGALKAALAPVTAVTS